MIRLRSGYTMLELVFVIVILGVVGMVSTELVRNMYQNYATQRSLTKMQSLSELSLLLVSSRLERAIFESIVDEKGRGLNRMEKESRPVLQWIEKDIESLQGIWDEGKKMVYPAYSGFADIQKGRSSGNTIVTTDSIVGNIDMIQAGITGMGLNSSGYIRTALYFPIANSEGNIMERFWSGTIGSLFPITAISTIGSYEGSFALDRIPDEIGELYYLAYTASAVVFENNTLMLHTNFRPWNGDTYKTKAPNHPGEITKSIILENVKSFEAWGEGEGTIVRLKLCMEQDFGFEQNVTFCKESAVIL